MNLKSYLTLQASLVAAFIGLAWYGHDLGAAEVPESVVRVWRLTDPELDAHRPRFSPDGSQIVFFAGPEGSAEIYRISVDGTDLTRLTDHAADDRDPVFSFPDQRIVWSSNREGGFDLYSMAPDGTDVQRLTAFEGDEVEPAVSPLQYTMYQVGYDEGSEDGAFRVPVDTYGKVVFTRRVEERSEIWFVSTNTRHQGQITPAAMSCHSPSWSGNGLSLAWTCDGEEGSTVFHSEASWDQSFRAAMDALAAESGQSPWDLPACDTAEGWEQIEADPCLAALPRRYSTYSGQAIAEPAARLGAPTYSANQTLLLAHQAEPLATIQYRLRTEGDAWRTLPLEGVAPCQVAWSPTGRLIAFESEQDGRSAVYLAEMDFYLQDVVDLVDYPELYGEGASLLLQDNHFVARPGTEREFFRYYDQLGYRHRAPFVTADATLQVFHDEFAGLLRRAEGEAARALEELTESLLGIYAGRLEESDSEMMRYYAQYFGVGWALLHTAASLGQTGSDYVLSEIGELLGPWEAQSILDRFQAGVFDPASLAEYLSPEEIQQVIQVLERSTRSYEDLFSGELATVMAEVPEPVRESIQAIVADIMSHSGIGTISVPGRPDPFYVDWTQFIARGHYENSELTGYFLAMMWFGQVPLPIDSALFDLVERMEQDPVLWERYTGIDTLVGAFMGRPVDVTLGHVRQVRQEHSELLSPYQAEAVASLLAELRGPVPFRGLQVAMAQLEGQDTDGQYPLQCTLFPRRYGLDVEFFSRLTHPAVNRKPYPTALEVFAGLGLERAAEHALALARSEIYLEDYREALRAVAEFGSGLPDTYFSTDIYHSWFAVLRALATPCQLAPDSTLTFARTSAWQDRLLFSSLAGYAQLKHDAILYSFQEYGVEAGGDQSVLVLTEQPVIPPPQGFVDPVPEFFQSLSQLAGRVYQELTGGAEPSIEVYLWSRPYHQSLSEVLSAQRFAARLAEMAAREVQQEPLSQEDNAWLLLVGPMMEQMFLNMEYMDEGTVDGDEGRTETGVALVADVYTNVMRNEVLELAVGRIMDLYVVVDNPVGRRMTQGGLYSFYEFTHPMADRLTDLSWNARIEAGDLPPLPPWTGSFIEMGPTGAAAPTGSPE